MFTLLKRITFVVIGISFTFSACIFTKETKVPPVDRVTGLNDSIKEWVNWVGVFKTTTSEAARNNFMDTLRQELLIVRSDYPVPASDSLSKPFAYHLSRSLQDNVHGPFQILNVSIHACNCPDTLLWNITADLYRGTDTTGPSTPTAPKPGGGNVSGGLIETVVLNETLSNPTASSGFIDAGATINFPMGFRRGRTVLAIIDTGIDSLLFDESVRRDLFWNGPSGSQNLLTGANVNDYKDDHPVRHGSSVAALAMNAYYRESNNTQLPQLMILKAADSLGHGNLFEYACALAYAIRNKATVINSSMGFIGDENSLIEYYAAWAKRDSIPIVAAAGNADNAHAEPLCRQDIDPANRLQPGRMFYPAVLARNMLRFSVISVAGVSQPGLSCYYQNYSPDYVTLGVMNQLAEPNCCAYRLPFIAEQRAIEGSSFATPVVAGRITFQIGAQGKRPGVSEYLSMMGGVISAPVRDVGPVTVNNQYIVY